MKSTVVRTLWASILALALVGCGGSGGAGSSPGAGGSVVLPEEGRLSLTLEWPAITRLVPLAATSVQIEALRPDDSVVNSVTVPRPEAGGKVTESLRVPKGDGYRVRATARDAKGKVLGLSTVGPVRLSPGATAELEIAVEGDISKIETTTTSLGMGKSEFRKIEARAFNRSGVPVMVNPDRLAWNVDNPAILRVQNPTTQATDGFLVVEGVAAGTANVFLRDLETGLQAVGLPVQVIDFTEEPLDVPGQSIEVTTAISDDGTSIAGTSFNLRSISSPGGDTYERVDYRPWIKKGSGPIEFLRPPVTPWSLGLIVLRMSRNGQKLYDFDNAWNNSGDQIDVPGQRITALSGDGQAACVVVSPGNQLRWQNLSTGEVITVNSHPNYLSEDGTSGIGYDPVSKTLFQWTPTGGSVPISIPGHIEVNSIVGASSDVRTAYGRARDILLNEEFNYRWTPATGFQRIPLSFRIQAVSGDGETVASTTLDGTYRLFTIYLWSPKLGQILLKRTFEQDSVGTVTVSALSYDGSVIAVNKLEEHQVERTYIMRLNR